MRVFFQDFMIGCSEVCMLKPLPSGIEFFEEFNQKGYYYIDKTPFIKNLIDNMGKVNLFTRPRRFGKTLTLDMLRCFFEEGRDPGMFAGLKILKAGEKYTSMMGKYPVIFLTLKSAKTGDEKRAFSALRNEIAREFDLHSYVLDSGTLSEKEKMDSGVLRTGTLSQKSMRKV